MTLPASSSFSHSLRARLTCTISFASMDLPNPARASSRVVDDALMSSNCSRECESAFLVSNRPTIADASKTEVTALVKMSCGTSHPGCSALSVNSISLDLPTMSD